MRKRKLKHRCKRCNRVLTDAKSIKLGFGPECFKKEEAHFCDSWWDMNYGMPDPGEFIGE